MGKKSILLSAIIVSIAAVSFVYFEEVIPSLNKTITIPTTKSYPQHDFINPMKGNISLSANFGALRSNHFHSGLDIRTNEQEGIPVMASAAGTVVRIKVSPYGYGNALYIAHPNGYTTVYAHLQQFNDKITEYVRKQQYAQKRFAVELYPPQGMFLVSQGEVIALSGNSGGSTGPHLHFEIRDSRTEEPIDPLLFNLDIKDKYSPVIKSIDLHLLDKNIQANYGFDAYKTFYKNAWPLKTKDTLTVNYGNYGIATNAADFIDTKAKTLGINYATVYDNGKQVFNMHIDRFHFDETRFINCHIDYSKYKAKSQRVHKCYRADGNLLRMYEGSGIITVNKTNPTHHLKLVVYDLAGNRDSIEFVLKGDDNGQDFGKSYRLKQPPSDYYFFPSGNNIFFNDNIRVSMPAGAIYDTFYFTYQQHEKYKGAYSATHELMSNRVPVQKNYTLKIKAEGYPEGKESKLYIASKNGWRAEYEGGTFSDGWVTATTREFGKFYVALDDTPPTVTSVNIRSDGTLSNSERLTFRITDNESGINTYDGYLDGEWWLMEYDANDDYLFGYYDEKLTQGKHTLKVVVTDERGNKTEVQRELIK